MEERKQIQIFNNPEFGDVRIIQGEDGEPRFCLLDICRVLDLKSFKVNQRLNDNILSKYAVSDSIGRQHVVSFIDEDGLYDVILDSRKPEAKKFRKWVTSEVLPSIRKHGAYMTEATIERALKEPDFLIELATNLKKEQQARELAEAKNVAKDGIIQEQQQAIKQMKVRQSFVDYIMSTPSCVCITQIAKEYGLSAKKLNQFLHEKKIQYSVMVSGFLMQTIRRKVL